MPFNTETIYMLWDAEHNGETINYLREENDSYFFDEDGVEFSLVKANVVDLGDGHPPADKEVGKHYISTYDGSVSYGASLPSSPQNSQNSLPLSQISGSSQATGANETSQSGGRRKKAKGKGKKTKKARKSKAKKTKKVKRN
jgi:hypothetical protein